MNKTTMCLAAAAVVSFGAIAGLQAQQAPMTFFVTSANPGKGADLGGLAGADAYCQQLAQAVGAGSRTWHAYLSLSAAPGVQPVNARDRIGRGPWHNVKGVQIAADVADLHKSPNINKQTALTEKGDPVNGFGDTAEHSRHPDRHAAGRHRVHRRGGSHLRQLDQERRRQRHRRPPRPAGT